MRTWNMRRRMAGVAATAVTVGLAWVFSAAVPVSAHGAPAGSPAAGAGPRDSGRTAGGDPNAGDVWLDTVTRPAGPGHEMDPHLPCTDITLWVAGLADSAASYTIDGWPPSGSQEVVYSAQWTYRTTTGGDQAISVVPVQQLIAAATANGDAPVNGQGFHFMLDLTQDPQKHKTFWVDCTPAHAPASTPTPVPTPAGGTGGVGSTPTATPLPSAVPVAVGAGGADSTPSPDATPLGAAPASSNGGGGAGGVLGVATSTPATGVAMATSLAVLLVVAGAALVAGARRRRHDIG